jgi:hypothetical protein
MGIGDQVLWWRSGGKKRRVRRSLLNSSLDHQAIGSVYQFTSLPLRLSFRLAYLLFLQDTSNIYGKLNMLSLTGFTVVALFTAAAVATTPSNLDRPSTDGALSGLRYEGVGGSGSYQQVVDMPKGTFPTCTINPSCVKTTKSVSGKLAPFNEELTLVLRGPLNVKNIAVYQPSASTQRLRRRSSRCPAGRPSSVLTTITDVETATSTSATSATTTSSASSKNWGLVSSFSSGQKPNNLIFFNNKGGKISGEWSSGSNFSQVLASNSYHVLSLSGRISIIRKCWFYGRRILSFWLVSGLYSCGSGGGRFLRSFI